MKLCSLMLSMAVASTALAQSKDPFIGTWVYSDSKSHNPTITYSVKDLGTDHYALTGSSGETTELRADGSVVKLPSGQTVSFKKLDAHTWHMERVDSLKMERTYTVSEDDTRLTLVDIVSSKRGLESKTIAQYKRAGPGKSLFGNWKSLSVEVHEERPSTMVIGGFGDHGLSMTFLPENRRVDLLFDGKQYVEKGPDDPLETSKSGRRINPDLVRLIDYMKGKVHETHELRVSKDGKTLTSTTKRPQSLTVFTGVWDKK